MLPESIHTLEVKDMEFYAYHGCMNEEAVIGGRYRVNVMIRAKLGQSCLSDRLEDTIDYSGIFEVARKEMEQRSKLIEHVGHRILQSLCRRFPQIQYIRVEIIKLNPPVPGRVGAVSYIQEKKF